MIKRSNATGFEYINKKTETPFETFLRYTDEKEQSAVKLASILEKKLHDGSTILDIGTGNGEYLKLALSKLENLKGLKLGLVEPSDDLTAQLEDRLRGLSATNNITVISSDLQNFVSSEKFDVILMSHLFYHIPRPIWAEQLTKALSLLKSNGTLIVVLREKDDAYDFKMEFKPLLFDVSFKALTIEDVLSELPISEKLKITRHTSLSELRVPLDQNMDDSVSIIEFYLNKQWIDIPASIQLDSLEFIRDRGGILKQRDGIAEIVKL